MISSGIVGAVPLLCKLAGTATEQGWSDWT